VSGLASISSSKQIKCCIVEALASGSTLQQALLQLLHLNWNLKACFLSIFFTSENLRIIIIDFIQINKKQNGKNKEKPVY
jgi:hypothetical protein